jgi:hypothetical protein
MKLATCDDRKYIIAATNTIALIRVIMMAITRGTDLFSKKRFAGNNNTDNKIENANGTIISCPRNIIVPINDNINKLKVNFKLNGVDLSGTIENDFFYLNMAHSNRRKTNLTF